MASTGKTSNCRRSRRAELNLLVSLSIFISSYASTKKRRFPRKSYRRTRWTQFRENTNPCAPPGFPLRSIEELLQAHARRNQPTLHPEKRDGALWISIDDEVKYDIKRAFSNDFDGAWWNLSEVPPEQQDKWWSDFVMMELGEEPAITYLVRKAHTKSDGTFVDKRAHRIIEEVESIVVSEHPNTDETDSQGSNSEASITPLMRDEAFYKVVKPHKGRLFGLGTAQMENYDHIAPPVVVLTRQAQLEKEVINLTGMVKLMSQQLTALCEARGVTASDATTNPSPFSPPTTNEPRI
uniref:Uncharacterized protein n=1 Tax=Brassica oleracea var. oleracea TaxID=109376 RepID=A0A0D3CRN5_BRAOL